MKLIIIHEREARVIYSLTTDLVEQPVIYLATNRSLARLYFDSNIQKTIN